MASGCDSCHRCCVNGEYGVAVRSECENCGQYMQLYSNNLTDDEFNERCNCEACGCGDRFVERVYYSLNTT